MCNTKIRCLSQCDNQADQVFNMDSPTALALGSTPSSNEESTRVKFLCSFLGSILPRPQDGKLRYVGGETRIVSVPRDIMYEDFMGKMKELYEGVTVLKYQQPDEDLDALVSVVNDDDVTNMMEEYDKLGSGDGFTRLRIFLFSQPDQDISPHFIDGDEKDSEKRYVDALNNLNDGLDLRKQQVNEYDSPMVTDHFMSMNLEGSVHGQRNYDISLPHNNLRNLTVPQLGTGQHQLVPQRYNEMEAPWSPAYYSPQHHGLLDPRLSGEFPSSPSSARYHFPFNGEMPEDFSRQQIAQQSIYEHPPQFTENAVWLPNGIISGDKAGFPGNILHGHGPNSFEGNSICEQCRITFQRSQPEQPNMGGGYLHAPHHCIECPPNRDTFIMNNTDSKIHHGGYNEIHNHERGWALHHPVIHRVEEPRPHIPPSPGRINDPYIVDNSGMSLPLGHVNLPDGHQRPSNYVHHEDPLRYGHLPFAYGTDNIGPGTHGHIPIHPSWRNVQPPVHIPPSYEAPIPAQQANGTVNPVYFRGTIEGSPRFRIGMDNPNPWVESSQKMMGFNESLMPEYPHGHALRLNQATHVPENKPIDDPGPSQSSIDLTTFVTPSETVKLEDPPLIMIDVNPEQGNSTDVVKLEDQPLIMIDDHPEHRNSTDVVKLEDPPLIMIDDNSEQKNSTDGTDAMRHDEVNRSGEEKVAGHVEKVDISDIESILSLEQPTNTDNIDDVESLESITPQNLTNAEESGDVEKLCDTDISAPLKHELSLNHLSSVAELTASVKQEVLNNVEEVKAKIEENDEHGQAAKEAISDGLHGSSGGHEDMHLGSDNDNIKFSKIEPTKAEEEAISRGLQTIRNDDLEEFRELGSGTYGAVYHGKWKGSDVAIKRIKASCFAGRPSERERLIADFWKEALILGSLHHPNVVSFYGIVRDGPDGSLATVTEFMINGSLKQFLQKKDRTIDRRKRLIIAMDSAFGMEYLHGKNIVHFDLKCENLLVNMRDPHRPVCKIGDLGLSKVKQHTLVSGGVRGTLPWMAPELLSGKSHMVTEKIDVYSFGIVMWELLTGEEPYADMHCASIIGGIVNNMLRPQIPTWCDPEWKSLMESCWASEPSERPSFSEISQKLRNMAAAMNLK